MDHSLQCMVPIRSLSTLASATAPPELLTRLSRTIALDTSPHLLRVASWSQSLCSAECLMLKKQHIAMMMMMCVSRSAVVFLFQYPNHVNSVVHSCGVNSFVHSDPTPQSPVPDLSHMTSFAPQCAVFRPHTKLDPNPGKRVPWAFMMNGVWGRAAADPVSCVGVSLNASML